MVSAETVNKPGPNSDMSDLELNCQEKAERSVRTDDSDISLIDEWEVREALGDGLLQSSDGLCTTEMLGYSAHSGNELDDMFDDDIMDYEYEDLPDLQICSDSDIEQIPESQTHGPPAVKPANLRAPVYAPGSRACRT